MAYCGPRGIPLSVFLGWPQGDQDAALAWQADQDARCATCGTHPEDWDPEAGGHRMALRPELYRCRGCERLEQLQQSSEPAEAGRGVHIRMVRNPPELLR